MTIPINKFLISLMAAIEARTVVVATPGLVWFTADPTALRSLWLSEIEAERASPTSSVIRPYGGGSPSLKSGRLLTTSLQVLTRGAGSPEVMDQAWMLQEAMLSPEGHPAVHWAIPGKILTTVGGVLTLAADPVQDWEVARLNPLQTPGILGRAEDRKWEASCNWDCEFARVAK